RRAASSVGTGSRGRPLISGTRHRVTTRWRRDPDPDPRDQPRRDDDRAIPGRDRDTHRRHPVRRFGPVADMVCRDGSPGRRAVAHTGRRSDAQVLRGSGGTAHRRRRHLFRRRVHAAPLPRPGVGRGQQSLGPPRGTYAHSHREHAMSQEDRGGDRIEGTVTGDVSGQVAIGKNIRQQSTDGQALTPDERAELNRMLAELRARVAAEAPEAEREAALERVGEVEEELAGDDPDPVTLAYVRQWFLKKLPG